MVGRTISHYRILEKLGEGGMGVVYKAEDTKLKRTVALKFLPPESTRDTDARERFIHEAQAAAALDHPDICTIYEIDETQNHTFISMAYIAGERLKDKIDRGPLKLEEALDMRVPNETERSPEMGEVQPRRKRVQHIFPSWIPGAAVCQSHCAAHLKLPRQ